MSRRLAEPIVRSFVRGEHREANDKTITGARILALRGRWGVGKTVFWNKIVGEEQGNAEKPRRYGYVSLFGLNSLEEVRSALTVRVAISTKSSSGHKAKPLLADTISGVIQGLPIVGGAIGAGGALLGAMAFEVVREALVCFDDIERLGGDLSVRDLLGLATQLRDERGCDVAFILNDAQFDASEDDKPDQQSEFDRHGEKALDYQVRFSPTAEEAIEIAFGSGAKEERSVLWQCCQRLSITNIRILQRIKRGLDDQAKHTEGASARAEEMMLRSLVLMTWAYHDSVRAPDFGMARKPASRVDYATLDEPLFFQEEGAKPLNPKRVEWLKLLGKYDYFTDAPLNALVADYVEQGYFDEEALAAELARIDDDVNAEAELSQHAAAWDLYRNSFSANRDEFESALARTTERCLPHLSLPQFSNALVMLRRLDKKDLANNLIDTYVEHHLNRWASTPAQFSRAFMRHHTVDPELERRAKETMSSPTGKITLRDALERTGEDEFVEDPYVSVIHKATAAELAAEFGEMNSRSLPRAVYWCLSGGSDGKRAKEIKCKTEEALRMILGQARFMNRLRMIHMYGFDPDAEEVTTG